jgi:hypothetical protein
VSRLVTNFQTEFKLLITESDDIELENYCALTNSNIKFISCMRSFLDGIKENTGIEIEPLQKSFQANFLMKNFAEISNSSYLRIQDTVKAQVASGFLSIKDYKSVVIVDLQSCSMTSSKICS